MSANPLIHFLLQSYLNPVVFGVYLFVLKDALRLIGIQILIEQEQNKYQIELKYYLLLAPFLYVIWLIIDFVFLRALNSELQLLDFISYEYSWLNIIVFALTLFLIKELTSKKGIAINLLGFIYAPLAAMTLVFYVGLHFFWLYRFVLI